MTERFKTRTFYYRGHKITLYYYMEGKQLILDDVIGPSQRIVTAVPDFIIEHEAGRAASDNGGRYR